ncbi:MAG TPA: hypothetical protein VF783_10760 [Terriglobales bacterium]
MPGFKCRAKVLFRELRVQCALSVFVMLLLSHANASAQSVPSCAWRLEIVGGSSTINAFYPDTDASYWTMPVDTAQWKQVILQGQYPQSRFFSFTTYVAKGSTADGTYDINIDPNAGSSNPFRRGSTGPQDNYTVNVGGPSGQTNHVNFGNTRLAWIVYRIYVANQGLDPMAGVPLPAVTLVDANGGKHSIAPCNTPQDQQINLLIDDLRDDGFDELAHYWQTKFTEGDYGGRTPDPTCQPEDQVVFWIPQNTGGLFANPYIGYIAGPYLCFHPGKFVIVRGEAADFPDTYNGNPVWQPALPGYIQLRYWSMCNNEQVAPYPVVACQPDHATNLDHRYYTYVLGKGDSPPSWLPEDATWLPWGSTRVSNILIFRNMLPTTPQFDKSVQAAIAAGCVVDNQPNTPPPRDQVVAAGACAERVMKGFYPKAVYCDESVFQRGGWQACFGQ